MQEVTLKTYKFNELSKDVQNSLLDENRFIDYIDNWGSDLISYFKERIATSGLEIDEVASIVNHSQGDGCAIIANSVDFSKIDIDKLLAIIAEYDESFDKEKLEQLKFWKVSCSFDNDSSRYARNSYAHNMDSETLFEVQDQVSYNSQVCQFTMSLFSQLEETLVELANTLSGMIYKVLSDESLYLTSDEYLIDRLADMDLDYLENGNEI